MAALDAIVIPSLTSGQLLGLQDYLLEGVAALRCRPALLIYALEGRLISLGRYHLYQGPHSRGAVGCYRRLAGGRITGAGEGWIGCALIAPSIVALLPERDSAIRPEQVMNRYVRGVIGGLRKLGAECFYPGRDAITTARREIAMCSFEVDRSGALLFEVLLAVERGLGDTVGDLERLDPDGGLTFPMYHGERASTLARELRRRVSFEELAGALASGYASLLGEVSRRELSAKEQAQADRRAGALAACGWLTGRRRPPGPARVARMASQLGFVEAQLALGPDDRIERMTLAGDFLASSAGLDEFERALRGCRPDLPSLTAVAAKVFAGANFILGIGELPNLVRLIMKAS